MLPNHLFNQTITLYTRSGHDRYGKESYGAGATHKARVQQTSKTTFQFNREGSDATQYVISLIVYLKSDITINEGDKITFSSVDYRVHSKKPAIDGTGSTRFIRVDCTKWEV